MKKKIFSFVSVCFLSMPLTHRRSLFVAGILDSSGLRFHYTSQLREYQAGILTVGWLVSGNMIIPPHQESWETQGYCVEDCTKEVSKNEEKLISAACAPEAVSRKAASLTLVRQAFLELLGLFGREIHEQSIIFQVYYSCYYKIWIKGVSL